MPKRAVLLFALVAVGLALMGVLVWKGAPQGPAPAASGQAQVGGPFQLTDQNGRAVDESLLKGKWTAVFFGFTFCPDVCPTTLQALGQAKRDLGAKGRDLQVVLVTVDPERDTPAQLNTYLQNEVFPEGTIGLTGTPEQIAAIAKAYKTFYQKTGEGPDYLMEHSSVVYLMNRKGEFDRALHYGLSPDQLRQQISDAME